MATLETTAKGENGLPLLPGYTFEEKKTDYSKNHIFDKYAGLSYVKESPTGNKVNRSPKIERPKVSMLTDVEKKSPSNMNVSPEKLPAWVAYDRKVLRFYCYFMETVDASADENYRVRQCVLYYYLEDDSIHVAEPKEENSGIPQGMFVKRHRIQKPDGSYFTADDLRVGELCTIYNRVFKVYDCDDFTRQFYTESGRKPQGDAHSLPLDSFHSTKASGEQFTFHKTMSPMKKYIEATLGKLNEKDTKRFLTLDRKVLRFFVRWDDPGMFGETCVYTLHYYLSDKTMEILEKFDRNSGKDGFPTLLKRQKVPKNYHDALPNLQKIGTMEEQVKFYEEMDLQCGETIRVFNRDFRIVACDKFTKNYYLKEHKYVQVNDLVINSEIEPKTEPVVPPYTGFGSEEDSMGSVIALVPKPPKIDFKKFNEFDRKELRFMAKLANPTVQDIDRRFIVTFYLADDKLSVYEKIQRNSGFLGGKFMERTKMKNPATKKYFEPNEFYVGAEIGINSYVFQLLGADEFTLKYMEGQPIQFPHSDLVQVGKKIRQCFEASSKQSAPLFRMVDDDHDGKIAASEFKGFLAKKGIKLNEQQVLTLIRKFDTDCNGYIDFKEFIRAINDESLW